MRRMRLHGARWIAVGKPFVPAKAATLGQEAKISLDGVQTLACLFFGRSSLEEEFIWFCDVGVKAAECTHDAQTRLRFACLNSERHNQRASSATLPEIFSMVSKREISRYDIHGSFRKCGLWGFI